MKALTLVLVLAAQTALAASTPTLPLGADLADIVKHDLDILPDAKPILESMQPSSPFHQKWTGFGAYSQTALDAKNPVAAQRDKQRWRGPVAIQSDAVKTPSERAYVVAAGMLSASTGEIVVRRFKVALARPGQPNEGQVTRVEDLPSLGSPENDPLLPAEYRANAKFRQDVKASEMDLSIRAGLRLRVFMLKDEEHGIRFTYPLGVGSIDPGLETPIPGNDGTQANLLTPTFADARLDKKTVWSRRSDQKHFRGEPFLRVMKGTVSCRRVRGVETCTPVKGTAGWTAVGFHITIMGAWDYTDNFKTKKVNGRTVFVLDENGNKIQNKGPEWLTRGFDSHGCMRLRRNDVRFVHDLVMQSPDDKIIDVKVQLEAEPERNALVRAGQAPMTEYHPWPIENVRYKRVKNFGGQPKRDLPAPPGDGLVITEQMPKQRTDAPVTIYNLAGLTVEQMEQMRLMDRIAEGADRFVTPPPVDCDPVKDPENCKYEVFGSEQHPEQIQLVPGDATVAPVPKRRPLWQKILSFGILRDPELQDQPVTQGEDYTSVDASAPDGTPSQDTPVPAGAKEREELKVQAVSAIKK
jgi:hypothetical protein